MRRVSLGTRPFPRDERGIALIKVLLLITLVLGLGIFGSTTVRTQLRIANNEYLTKQAFAIADAGLNHIAQAVDTGGFDDELSNGGTGGVLTDIGTAVTLDGKNYRYVKFGGIRSTDGYYVRFFDNWDEIPDDPTKDADGKVTLQSRGRFAEAERTLESFIVVELGPRCAANTCEDLQIGGSVELKGPKGCSHSNGRTEIIGGKVILEAGATTSEDLKINSSPTLEGVPLSGQTKATYIDTHSNRPAMYFPTVRPFAFGSTQIDLAKAVEAQTDSSGNPVGYRLDANCKVYKSGGGGWACNEKTADCNGGAVVGTGLPGWSCAPGDGTPAAKWSVSGTPPSAVYFIEGSVDINGPSGTWAATLVALNSVQSNGATMVPYTTTGDLRNLLVVSGNDVRLRGNFGSGASPGAIYAHQQLDFKGNPTIYGYVVAEDGCTTWEGDPAPNKTSASNLTGTNTAESEDELMGNVTISYSGVDTVGHPSTINYAAWNDARSY